MIRIRRLTEVGFSSLEAALAQLSESPYLDGPLLNLDDPALAELHVVPVSVDENKTFGSRFEAADYLYSVLGSGRIENVENDRALWAWLAVLWFDELCPPDGNGRRRVGERARYIPSTVYTKEYRHLLAGPYRLFQAHAENPHRALAALANPLDRPGELAEQLSATKVTSGTANVIAAATQLYIDRDTKRPKPGSGNANSRGSVRRFSRILQQFDLTWDLASMTPESIVARLPEEFARFRK